MFNVHAVRGGTDTSVFQQSDPAQESLRMVLHGLSEADLADLEQDIEYFAISGVFSGRIERLLVEAEHSHAAVA